MDAFCGVGGNAVHFARRCRHVIGVDNCRARLDLAQQNARVYGVADRLDLICADFFDLRDQLKVGSPPGSEKTIFLPPLYQGLPGGHMQYSCRLKVLNGTINGCTELHVAES